MATHIDVFSTQDDPGESSLTDSTVGDHAPECGPGDITLTEGLVQGNVLPLSPKVYVTDDSDAAPQEQSPRHLSPPKSDHGLADVPTGKIDDQLCRTLPQSDYPINLPEEFSEPEVPVDPAVGTPSINTNDDGIPMDTDPQRPPVLCPNIASPAALPRDKKGADAGDPLPDATETACTGRVTDEEGDQEDIDRLFNQISSPLPPSSSPPQLFSSSPYASSQSSVGDIQCSKTDLAVETLDRASDSDGRLVSVVAQDDRRSELEDMHGAGEAASENDACRSQVIPPSDMEDTAEFSRKRVADSDPHEPYGLRPIKRPNLDSHLYLPPAPKRATAASQRYQFKKLAAPFRPPLKVSIDGDRPVQVSEERKAESTTDLTLETRRDKTNNQRGSGLHSQRKTPNTPKSVTQFKSPLARGAAPADSRTVRLTPALQALERKLQLLKRAIKVKEDNEEEVLIRLAGKWIEAGREVAYEVWDAVKDTGDFAGKATLMHRSQGWESTDNAKTPWGWDIKRGDGDEDSSNLESSEVACTAEQQVPEDDDVGYNTLGTMLRQLGIAPEIFGWDDEKEAFSD